jgi:DNA-binding FrmR family transcriptional regulator
VEGWERTKCDLDCFWEGLGMFGGSSARPAQGGKQDGLLELRSSYGLAELLAELGQESRLVAHGESLDIVAPSTQGQEVIPSPPGGGYPPMRRHGPEDPAAKERILARLRSVDGHLRGVLQMVEKDAYCVEVLQQTKAIHSALSKVEGLLLNRHLQHCVTAAVRAERPQERERVIAELLDLFEAKGGSGR